MRLSPPKEPEPCLGLREECSGDKLFNCPTSLVIGGNRFFVHRRLGGLDSEDGLAGYVNVISSNDTAKAGRLSSWRGARTIYESHGIFGRSGFQHPALSGYGKQNIQYLNPVLHRDATAMATRMMTSIWKRPGLMWP